VDEQCGMNLWRAGCVETCKSGSEGGSRKRTGREAGTAPRSDPYTHFTRCKRVTYAVVDVVTRYWIGYLLTSEQTHTQVQLLFARALEDQDLLDADGLPPAAEDGLPILVA
jgi:hypothetical protein